MAEYIHQLADWPAFTWDYNQLTAPLAALRYRQGKLFGRLSTLDSRACEAVTLDTLTLDVVKSSEIEGEQLSVDQVRSSIAAKLNIEIAGLTSLGRDVEGIVDMMIDATQNYEQALTEERLWGWQAALFPTGRSGMAKITTGDWRKGPMQVVSGQHGKERVHFEAPEAPRLPEEMRRFLNWFNAPANVDPVLKAAIAHLWFVTIHPFSDGNGRISRAIADMQLARADGSRQRFYSMSEQIQQEHKVYYNMLETTQKGNLDVTEWLLWFIACLDRALSSSEKKIADSLGKDKFWKKLHDVEINPRQKKILNRLIDGFEGKLTSQKWAIINKCSPDTALRDLQDLIEKGIMEKEEAGGRSTSYRLRFNN